MPTRASRFYRQFLNNKFAIATFNIVLVLLAIWIFTKIAWLFTPVLSFLGIIAPPFLLAGVLFYLLNPIVNWLTRHRFRRIWAILLVFVLVIVLLVLLIAKLVPPVEQQARTILNNLPNYWTALVDWLSDLNDKQNLISDSDLNRIAAEIQSAVAGKEGLILSGTVASITGFVGAIGNVMVTVSTAPIVLFFMLKDGDRFVPMISQIFPVKVRASLTQMLEEMNDKVGSYVQGQLTVAIAVAIIFMIGYSIIGLRFALVLGLLAGPLNLIPYFGSALAMVPSLIVGWMASPKMFFLVILVFLVEWLLETQLISPLVMGSKLEMHPITIVVVILTAGDLFGLLGVILGIPGFAVLKIVVTRIFTWYQQVSGLYEEPLPAAATPAADIIPEAPKEKKEES